MFPGLKLYFPYEQLLRYAGANSDVAENPWSLTSNVMNVYALGQRTMDDWMVMDAKKNLDSSVECLWHLACSATSLAPPMHEGAYVSGHVTHVHSNQTLSIFFPWDKADCIKTFSIGPIQTSRF